MQTNRFETFMDAVFAIIITVLALKLNQPIDVTWNAVWDLNIYYLNYFICFFIIFNTWYEDHILFQIVDEIDNRIVFVYGLMIFAISVLPYFATWVALNPYSVPAHSMFGLLFVLINVCYTVSKYLIIKANPYNSELKKINLKDFKRYVPLLMILIGFLLTYTVYVQGIYISCLLATVYWFVMSISDKDEITDTDRFEALFDAVVAIVLTIVVLEITMANGGSWQALFDLKLEFVAYAISFIVCFNYWNYNNNLFHLVNKIDYRVIWLIGISMFLLSAIPYLSVFVAENFYSFVPQACYGIDFVLIVFLSIIIANVLKDVDKANIALQLALRNNYHLILTVIVVGVGLVIGYFLYPPAVIMSCLISILLIWLIPHVHKF